MLVQFLDEYLKPRGFSRRGRLWRKDAEKAIIAFRLWEELGDYDISFVAWFKELGAVDVTDVKPGGEYHFSDEIDGDLVPLRLKFRLGRALNFGLDIVDSIQRDYGTGEVGQEVASYFQPQEPLTTKWRIATLREAMDEHVLPWLERVEAGDQSVIPKITIPEIQYSEEELAKEWEKIKTAMTKCNEWRKEGIDEAEIMERLRKERLCGYMPEAAVVLSAALDLTFEEAISMVVDSDLWKLKWSPRQQNDLDRILESHAGIKVAPSRIVNIVV